MDALIESKNENQQKLAELGRSCVSKDTKVGEVKAELAEALTKQSGLESQLKEVSCCL